MIKISRAFVETNLNAKKGNCYFGYAVTKAGIAVCDPNSLTDFPELFEGVTIEMISVSPADIMDDEGIPWIDPKKTDQIKS